jgi:hypothetical protein
MLSLGAAVGHVKRLRRARDLLAVKGYDTSATQLAYYSRAAFDVGLRDAAHADPRMRLSGLDVLYSCDPRSGHGRRLIRRLWLSVGAGGATHCDLHVAEA